MIYVPILKNRFEEMLSLEDIQPILQKRLIPYIEVIKDEYKPRYKVDENGEFETEQKTTKTGKVINRRIKIDSTEEDIVTLEKIQNNLEGKNAFVEMLRFHDSEYDSYDPEKVKLALRLSADFIEFRRRTIKICEYEELTPVLSIKPHFEISEYDFLSIINYIRAKSKPVAVRIEISLFEKYASIFRKELKESDYLFVDIREQPYLSQIPALNDVGNSNVSATKILLNSPRHAAYTKKDFKEDDWEPLIINDVARKYTGLGFDGFGDYAGLKDSLPEDGFSSRSYAHVLIYQYDENKFWSIRNNEASEGLAGFYAIKAELNSRRGYFDPMGDCRGFERIQELNPGSYANWNGVIVRRYIDQMRRHIP